MKSNQHKFNSKQQGIALLMALIMLLIITVLGVSAVRMSSVGTQIAGNSIFRMLVFQGVESAIVKSITQENVIGAATDRTQANSITKPVLTGETVTAGVTLNSEADVIFDGILNGPVLNGVANSSEFNYQVFRFSAQSSIDATGVSDRHTEARAVQIPKP